MELCAAKGLTDIDRRDAVLSILPPPLLLPSLLPSPLLLLQNQKHRLVGEIERANSIAGGGATRPPGGHRMAARTRRRKKSQTSLSPSATHRKTNKQTTNRERLRLRRLYEKGQRYKASRANCRAGHGR